MRLGAAGDGHFFQGPLGAKIASAVVAANVAIGPVKVTVLVPNTVEPSEIVMVATPAVPSPNTLMLY